MSCAGLRQLNEPHSSRATSTTAPPHLENRIDREDDGRIEVVMKEKDIDLSNEVDRFIRVVIDKVEQGSASASEVTTLPEMVKIRIEFL